MYKTQKFDSFYAKECGKIFHLKMCILMNIFKYNDNLCVYIVCKVVQDKSPNFL